MRALILEDNPYDAELAVRALEQAGLGVEWLRVETSCAFEEALLSKQWDVIVADFSLPAFDASGALELLRTLGLDIPFVVVSGTINEEAAISLLRAGADDFITKGRLARLAPAVERAIREKREFREKRRAEGEVQVLARRWRLLLEHALDGIAVQEPVRDGRGVITDFRCLEWNRAAERILGVTREQALGQSGRMLFPGAEQTGLLAPYARVMDGGGSELIEGHSLTRGGRETILDISCFRLDEGHFVSLFRDVTGRKRSEEKLRQYAAETALGNRKLEQANVELERANEELERRNIELEEFTHVASHDLQEPLRKVVSFGDLLARELGGKLDAKCSQYLALMQTSTRRMQALIRDLLVMTRADRTPLRLEPKPLAECVRSALELLSGRIEETDAVVHIDPLPTLMVDPVQVCQLYQNLISNALKFGRPGVPPEISITCEPGPEGALKDTPAGDPEGTPQGSVVLGVADNGIGIEREYHEKIFEAFQRLHAQAKYEGSGIGLAVCRKVVTRHGGRIWVESEVGKGSHFRFVLDGGPRKEEREESTE